jgi:hypothetical protein
VSIIEKSDILPTSEPALRAIAMPADAVGLVVDWNVLRLYPSSDGIQHDERKSSFFKYAGKIVRSPVSDAPLHPSVLDRLALPDVVTTTK